MVCAHTGTRVQTRIPQILQRMKEGGAGGVAVLAKLQTEGAKVLQGGLKDKQMTNQHAVALLENSTPQIAAHMLENMEGSLAASLLDEMPQETIVKLLLLLKSDIVKNLLELMHTKVRAPCLVHIFSKYRNGLKMRSSWISRRARILLLE